MAKLLRITDVIEMVGLSKASIYRLILEGKFPKSVSLTGSRAVAWRVADIEAWVEGLA